MHTFLVLISLVIALGLTSACSPAARKPPSTEPYWVTDARRCGKAVADQTFFSIFDQTTDLLRGTGWSHVANPAKPVFSGLGHSPLDSRYNIPALLPMANDTCPGERIYQGILVKKYADYENQHANGLEPNFKGPSFGQVNALVIELRIDSQNTRMPTKEQFNRHFSRWLDAAQLDQIDNQQINFRVSLLGPKSQLPAEGYEGAAELFVTLDPVSQANRWLRLEIPLDGMKFYKGLSYRQTPQQLADQLTTSIAGLQISAETRGNNPALYGKVARSFMRDTWGKPAIPAELFKEYGFSIRFLGLQLKS